MSAKIPATVITGFLGAGKTSMIRHLLNNAGGKRIALIINEFGEMGVDGEILKGCEIEGCEDENILELANGCICCTVADDFIPTIEKLLNRPQPPDHIVIETSGLALPKPLVKAFNWPQIRTRVTVDGVITVVDGPAVAAGLFAADPQAVQAQRESDQALDHDSPMEELFEEQLACADLVVMNKTDLMDGADRLEVEEEVRRQLRPAVKLLSAVNGAVNPEVLLGLGAAAEDDLDSRPSHHDNGEQHDHDDFLSFDVSLMEVTKIQPLLVVLHQLIEQHGILRIKGFVAIHDKPMRMVIQGVGDRIQHYFDRDWSSADERRGTLVFIGEQDLDVVAVRQGLATFVNGAGLAAKSIPD